MKIAVYPGSFDPVTMGHLNIIERCSKVFDKLIVAVLVNSAKAPFFNLERRVGFIKKSITGLDNVEVESFSGLLIKFLQEKNASVIVKGLRAISDFDYEFSMALMNRKINPDIETMFLMTEDRYAYISSSKIKEIYSLGVSTGGLLPKEIEAEVISDFNKHRAIKD